MSATLAESIDLRDVGPIEKLSLPVPAGGGLVVLRAKNGRGKTKALEAVETVLTGRGKLEVRDKALRGEVEAFGVHLTVAKSTRRSGELEVTSLEGKLSVAELVDPGLKQPEAADAKRIKALVTLSGVKPSDLAGQFRSLLGGRSEFETVVRHESLVGDDAVAAADRVKRDIEAAARKAEDQVKHAEGRAQANHQAAAGVDLAAECDGDALQQRLEEAVRKEAELKAGRDARAAAEQRQRQYREQYQTAVVQYMGPHPTVAEDEEKNRRQAYAENERAINALKAEMAVLEDTLAKLGNEKIRLGDSLAAAEQARQAAEQHYSTMEQWQNQLNQPLPQCATNTEMSHAVHCVKLCREAIEQAAVVRKAQSHTLLAEQAQEEALQHAKAAEQLREAAKGCDEVLSSAVAKLSGVLRVEAGRLVLDTHRGAMYFSDLSHGERWKIALDIAIDALGEGKDRGVIVVPQPAFEGLDDENRRLIAAHLKERGVVGITAECSEDEQIVAEVFDAG